LGRERERLREPEILRSLTGGSLIEGVISATRMRPGGRNAFPAHRPTGNDESLYGVCITDGRRRTSALRLYGAFHLMLISNIDSVGRFRLEPAHPVYNDDAEIIF
jgi:hypothetical protein